MFSRKRSHGRGSLASHSKALQSSLGCCYNASRLVMVLCMLCRGSRWRPSSRCEKAPVCSPNPKKKAPTTDCSAVNVLLPLSAFLKVEKVMCLELLLKTLCTAWRKPHHLAQGLHCFDLGCSDTMLGKMLAERKCKVSLNTHPCPVCLAIPSLSADVKL